MDNQGYCNDDLDKPTEKNPTINTTNIEKSIPKPYSTRSTLAQYLATCADGTTLISIGFLVTVPIVIIADGQNENSRLPLNIEQASWYACLLPTFQPLGCFLGGFLQNYIGRKHGLLVMHISCIVTWVVLYETSTMGMLYLSAILSGISIGFNESPGLTYVCEITTPKLRGTLVMCNEYNINIGCTIMFLLTSFISWRTSCLVALGWSIFSIPLLYFIPDSPVWLISKGRMSDAINALRWLRGGVSEMDVKSEFEDLCLFVQTSTSNSMKIVDQDCHSKSLWRRSWIVLKLLLEKSTSRPFILLQCAWLLGIHASLIPARSYLLVILNSLNLPIESNWLGLLYGLLGTIGGITCGMAVRFFGKRLLTLWSIIITSILSVFLGLYIVYQYELGRSWIFIVLFTVQAFTHTCVISMPWVLIGEVYPVKTKSIATGMTAAVFYVVHSISIKIFYYLQTTRIMTTANILILYGVLGLVGCCYLWIFMPETEGKTMAEIEELFADDARRSCTHFEKKK